MAHPRDVLLGSLAGRLHLPVCDHYSGTEVRMQKSLALQAEMIQELGACVFDATLDLEDGAPVGGEIDHAYMVVSQVNAAKFAIKTVVKVQPRIGVRVHAVGHPAFASDIEIVVRGAGQHLAYLTVPKVESAGDVQRAVDALALAGGGHIPLHVLVESPAAVHQVFAIAAHPHVQCISFGLMDFVSSHGGAIGAQAMGSAGPLSQFGHPLVLRAKLEIAAACHAYGKVPSHCVVTEFTDTAALYSAALQAKNQLGYSRMWSIHPAQIRPILAAFAPTQAEVDIASTIVQAAAAAQWAPTHYAGQLHDRASYRYYWQVIERAQRTGRNLPRAMQDYFLVSQP